MTEVAGKAGESGEWWCSSERENARDEGSRSIGRVFFVDGERTGALEKYTGKLLGRRSSSVSVSVVFVFVCLSHISSLFQNIHGSPWSQKCWSHHKIHKNTRRK